MDGEAFRSPAMKPSSGRAQLTDGGVVAVRGDVARSGATAAQGTDVQVGQVVELTAWRPLP